MRTLYLIGFISIIQLLVGGDKIFIAPIVGVVFYFALRLPNYK